jgi:hypothetical protein
MIDAFIEAVLRIVTHAFVRYGLSNLGIGGWVIAIGFVLLILIALMVGVVGIVLV